MGSIATKAASNFVFPGIEHGNAKNDSIELLTNNSNDYSIPITHIRHKTPNTLIFYSHGNAEDLYSIQDYLQGLSQELSVDIISWDYAGYGLHKTLDTVKPTEQNVYDDAQTVFDYVAEQKLPIVIWGRSLGSAPAIHVSVNNQELILGIIVESGFRSISRIVSERLHNIWDEFDNEALIKNQKIIPILFVHGKQDTVVPFEHGERLYELCPCDQKEYFWVERGGHNDLDSTYRSEILFRVDTFIEKFSKRS
tara:strand:+ start:49 stop:804 length:756 start_codon:yes stop_codon:yes gene_type:complete